MVQSTESSEGESSDYPAISELLRDCHVLLKELKEYNDFLSQHKKSQVVELRTFKNAVHAELKSLERIRKSDISSEKTEHKFRSSNFPFYSSMWHAAKNSSGLVAFSKRFYWDPDPLSRATGNSRRAKRCSALVDVVARDGLEWIKVSTVTHSRLLFDMAKAGWEGGSSSDNDPDAESYDAPSDDDEGIGLLKLAENLSRAAHAIRLRYKHPTVRFVLPKLREGTITEIDNVIYQMRSMGIVVQTAEDVIDSPPLENVLDRLLINEFESLTKIVNIDCTILLALVSDLSHTHVETQPWFHRAIRRQIEIEKSEPLFPNYLLPALHGRKLVCTVEAARRMREIVGLIGTPTEQERMALLMGDDPNDNKPQIIKGLQKLSQHDMPVDWDLPIKVVDANVDMSLLPRSAVAIGERLSSINKSVFFYGWYNGLTTISSNRTVAKEIEALVEENRSDDKETGPDICLCPTARSLVGKEKDRKP